MTYKSHKTYKTYTVLALLGVLAMGWFFFGGEKEEATASWYDDSWLYRKTLTINPAQVAGDLTDFPVLVSFTDSDVATSAQEDADDIIFIDSSGEKLAHEIESYASSTGTLVAWVKIPRLSATDETQIYMYYGNAGVNSQEQVERVWDEDFKGVWHLADAVTASDSTGNAGDGTPRSVSATSSGYINGGVDFFGANTDIEYDSSWDVDSLPITASAWINIDNYDDWNTIISKRTSWGADSMRFHFQTDQYDGEVTFGSYGSHRVFDYAVATGTWTYLTVVAVPGGTYLYVNGSYEEGVAPVTLGTDANAYVHIGSTVTGDFYDGVLDEVRISTASRTLEWIETEYNNQNDPASFFSVSAQEQGKGPVGYWSFDRGSGLTAYDESGQGNDGTITGAEWVDESQCVSGKCLYFDGVDLTRVEGVVAKNLDSLTQCMWVKAISYLNDDSDSYMRLYSGNGGLKLENDGRLEFRIETTGTWPNVESRDALELNKWHHVCVSYAGVGSEPLLYLNGSDNSISGDSGDGDLADFISNPFGIGGGVGVNEYINEFHGYIDEVKIYPYARSADEIKADYNAGLSGMQSNTGVAASFGGSSDKWMSDGLVGYWKFDESATTTGAVDSSGNGITGSYEDTASTTAGKYGNGAIFDGTDDYIDLGTTQLIDSDAPFTVSYWARLDGIGSYAIPLTLNTENSENWRTYYSSGNNYVDFGCDAYGEWGRFRADLSIEKIGYMHNVIITYNGQGKYDIDNFKFYANGVSKDLEAGTGFASDTGNSRIGNYSGGNSWWWDGIVDEVRIYNRALSPDEVQKLYEWAPGPVAWWKFDEYEGIVAYDSAASTTISGGNHGTLVNSPNWTRGKYGGAIDFTASTTDDDRITFPGDGIWDNVPDAFTVMAWVKIRSDGGGSQGRIIDTGDSIGPFIFQMDGINNPGLQVFNNNGYEYHTPGGCSECIPLNKWTHIAINWVAGTSTFYLDGIDIGGDGPVYGDVYGDLRSTNGVVAIGNRPSGTMDRDFDGAIDEVKFYTYARTQKQILEDMGAGQPAAKQSVLHLKFDEGKGATAYDSSIHGNNGTLYPGTGGTNTASSAMWSLNGHSKGAMEFDGVDDYVSIANSNELSDMAQISISTWIKPSESQGWSILHNGGVSSPAYSIYNGESSSEMTFRIGTDGGGDQDLVFDEVTEINVWQHYVFIWDGDFAYIYKDGEIVASGDLLDGDILNSSASLTIGNPDDNSNYNLDGLIDEVQIWNYALSGSEVKQVYNDTKGAVWGSSGSAQSATSSANSASASYCVPGDTAQCDPPVLELSFNENKGTTTYDTSGNGNDGVFVSDDTSPTWTRGKYGKGLGFDGSDQLVKVDQDSTINDIEPFTLSVWIKPDGTGNIMAKNEQGSGAAGSWNFRYRSDNRIGFSKGYDTTVLEAYSVNDSITLNQWQHVTVTWNGGNDASDDVDLYVNGIEVAHIWDQDGSGSKLTDGSDDLFIGNNEWGTIGFSGLIDEVKIYDYARTPAQIAWDYNKGGPVAHWAFNECSGSVIHDESGNGNDGTLHLGTGGVTATGTCAAGGSTFWGSSEAKLGKGGGSFDGGDDYVAVTGLLEEQANITVCAWVNYNSVDTNGGEVFSLGDYVSIRVDRPSFGIYGFYYDGSEWRITQSNIYKSGEGWHHILYLVDDDNDTQQLYIDGELAATTNYAGSITYSGQGSDLNIGRHANGVTSVDYSGLIDEVKVWNYALTAEQVKTEYTGGAVSFGE